MGEDFMHAHLTPLVYLLVWHQATHNTAAIALQRLTRCMVPITWPRLDTLHTAVLLRIASGYEIVTLIAMNAPSQDGSSCGCSHCQPAPHDVRFYLNRVIPAILRTSTICDFGYTPFLVDFIPLPIVHRGEGPALALATSSPALC